MNILVTGSSGWLGQTLVPRLVRDGHKVVGLDPEPGPTTEVVGSVVDRALVRHLVRDHGIEAIVHAAARHKPHIETHDNSEFVAVNVQGTLNLLEEAVAPGSKVDRFVFTSTTSLMISQKIRDGKAGGAKEAMWIDEDTGAARAAQHLRCHQARRRGAVPAVQPSAQAADRHPAHLAVLPRGGRHGACHRAVGRQHQGQRVPVPPAVGRGCGGSARRGPRQGAARSASTPSSSRP